ncbi:MAG: hypothetical protein V4682_01990 [Patescibacteria group bacterium]
MSQPNSDSTNQEGPPYTLERCDASAGNNEVALISIFADNDTAAEMRTAAHLQIAYPLTEEDFLGKRAIRLRDRNNRLLFGLPMT